MNSKRRMIFGVCGCLLGICVAFAFGAATRAPAAAPRYAVQYSGAILLITDNESNKLCIYENTGASSVLRQSVDLMQTGKKQLTATMTEEGKQ